MQRKTTWQFRGRTCTHIWPLAAMCSQLLSPSTACPPDSSYEAFHIVWRNWVSSQTVFLTKPNLPWHSLSVLLNGYLSHRLCRTRRRT